MALPTPRDLLTSLITTLSAPAPAAAPHDSPNPLRGAPPEKAALLSTLHVLFPSLLLPALDLLDRGLVTRVLRKPADLEAQRVEGLRSGDDGVKPGCEAEEATKAEEAEEAEEATEGGKVGEAEDEGLGGLYVVRSLASNMKRRDGYHVVLLQSWTCSCPSFTLDAFPPARATQAAPPTRPPGHGEGWSFGGLAADADAPCCKHLLACVLAERWGALGGYVPVRRVGRGEMAGLVAHV